MKPIPIPLQMKAACACALVGAAFTALAPAARAAQRLPGDRVLEHSVRRLKGIATRLHSETYKDADHKVVLETLST
ncbi:hypothetical protein ACFL2T_03425, partial [Elusimicrobiota bacterium]